MYFDKFDIVEAHYVYCTHYHTGQWSDLYQKLCRISVYYTPSPLSHGFESLTENGKEIYENLVTKGQ